MPRVPTYDLPQVEIAPLRAPRLDPRAVPSSGLGEIGKALGNIGDVFAQRAAKEKEEADTIRAEAQVNKLYEAQNELGYGQEGAFNVKGENVFKLDGPFSQVYRQRFDQRAQQLESELANDEQKRRFQSVAGRLRNQFVADLGRHEAREGAAFRQSTFEGVVSVEAENMSRAQDIANPDERQAAETAALARVRDNARLYMAKNLGLAPTQVDAKLLNLESAMHKTVVDRLLEARNPMGAKAYYEANRDRINDRDGGKIRVQIEKDGRDFLVNQEADRIWATLGPKSDAAAVNLDSMEREANKVFEKDADGRKLLVAELRQRQQAHDYSARERQNAIEGGIWQQVIDRKPLSAIRGSKEFRSLDGKSQAQMIAQIETFQKRNESDPATQMAKFAEYWSIASDPQRLASMSDAEIFARAPTMGPELTKHLLTTKQTLINKDDKVIEAKIDQDSFNYFAREAGLDPTPAGEAGKKQMGELKYRLETIIDAEQKKRTPPRQLTREEKDTILKKMLTEVPVTVKQPWYLPGQTTTETRRLFEVQYPQNIAIPPADRQIVVDALKRAGIANPTDAQVREGYIRLKMK